ncbi:LPD29 domain-containing protein, partial [Arthrobacter ramosus]
RLTGAPLRTERGTPPPREARSTMNTTTYVTAIDTAKLIRKALKAGFPGQKFSVQTDKYSGGATINILWTDGPSEQAVKEITAEFEGGKSDATGDFTVPVTQEKDGQRTRYGARHIWTERSVSEETYKAIEPEVLAALDLDAPDHGQSYQVPPLVLEACPGWHHERATIREFARAIANHRGTTQA